MLIFTVTFLTSCNQDIQKKPGNSSSSTVNSDPSSKQSSNQVVEINSVEDVLKLAKEVNEKGTSDPNTIYKLTQDLDFSNVAFTPIGIDDPASEAHQLPDSTAFGFNSTFDAQGHIIRNLNIEKHTPQDPESRRSGFGFFSRIGKYGIVKNLTMQNCSVTLAMSSEPVGLIAGSCAGQIINCNVEGKVSGCCGVGGIVGTLSGEITSYDTIEQNNKVQIVGCSAVVTLVGSNSVGGLVGSVLFARIENSTVSGTIIADTVILDDTPISPTYIGGFVGSSHYGIMNTCDSNMKLNIKSTGSYIGAFIGNIYKTAITLCKFNKSKCSSWDIIDANDYKNITDYSGYDIKPY